MFLLNMSNFYHLRVSALFLEVIILNNACNMIYTNMFVFISNSIMHYFEMLRTADKKRKAGFEKAIQGALLMEHAKTVIIP